MGQVKDPEPDNASKGTPKSDMALPHTITETTRIRRYMYLRAPTQFLVLISLLFLF
jgi:hypothetical protein